MWPDPAVTNALTNADPDPDADSDAVVESRRGL
jgi:hypothetical protein